MASLILGAGILLHDGIKKTKQKRRDKKAKVYEERYGELEREHKAWEGKRTNIMTSKRSDESRSSPKSLNPFEKEGERRSSESAREGEGRYSEGEDGPARWVSEAVGRSKTG
jgi:cytochrome c-type biogenesis protein CcmH/NrfG